jgi:hypothetical protein
MKILYALPGLVLFFAACEDRIIDSLPEPELEVISIVFSEARYNLDSNAITLSFDKRYEYDGIFETYNKERILHIENYLKERDFSIGETSYGKTELEFNLVPGTKIPEKIIFDTENPCYFYNNYSYYSYSGGQDRYAIITKKAFIGTPELIVLDRPPSGP